MSQFSDLQATHERLVNQAQSSEDILEQAQQYLKDIQSGSSLVSAARERDQLRANLRYWASYVYEKTKEYPNVDLLPSTVPVQLDRRVLFSAAGGVLVLLLFCALGYFGFVLPQQQIAQANGTVQANSATQVVQIATQRALANQVATSIALQTPTPTPTTLGQVETPPAETPTESNVTSVQITSVKDNDQVQPITSISGTYLNLAPGSSIHLIVQPLSQDGLRFPVKQYALVSANSTSGEWAIEAKFGQGADLEKPEDYWLSVVVAPDQDTRDKLAEAVDKGFREYPSGVFQFAQKVVLSRLAYTSAIDGVQVIYSSYLDIEGNMEIFTMNLDGSKQRRITYTSGVNEMFPSLSPDGRQIVYVGRKNDEKHQPIYSIDVMNSDGTNRQVVVKEALAETKTASLIYEHPLWSNDGKYIAYTVGIPQPEGNSHWNIYAYDVQKQESFQITDDEEEIANRYFSWIPNTLDIVFATMVEKTQTTGFLRRNIFSGKDKQIFFDDTADQLQPALSPDGTKLAYMQLDSGSGNIYVVNLAGGAPFQLTKGLFQDENPVWAPDNKTIFFESFEGGSRSIWSISLEDTNLIQVTTGKDQYPFVGYMYAILP